MSESKPGPWWGVFSLGVGERAIWHLGPMKLSLIRKAQEWAVEYVVTGDVREDALVECPSSSSLDGAGLEKRRFTFRESPESVRVRPALPDRNIVVYPESPFHVTAGESVTLFCSAPLWLRIEVGDGQLLFETPIDRPPDTWFGPSTREGELCYATRTAARLERESIPIRAHRALTELRIDNSSDEMLQLERISLAVPYLSLFVGPDGSLWTESVVLERRSAATTGKIEIGDPPAGSASETVTPARLVSETGPTLIRAFSALFG